MTACFERSPKMSRIQPEQALIGICDTVTFSCDSACGCSATDTFNGFIAGISGFGGVGLANGETSAPLGPATGAGWISYAAFVCSPAGQYFIVADSGPTIRMREPKVVADDVHSGPSGVSLERLIFSEPVIFGPSDIEIIDDLGAQVAFSVTGSSTGLMVISFATALFQDTYPITIKDTVVGESIPGPAIPLDGDDDGIAGGDAIITMEHRLSPSTAPSAGLHCLV